MQICVLDIVVEEIWSYCNNVKVFSLVTLCKDLGYNHREIIERAKHDILSRELLFQCVKECQFDALYCHYTKEISKEELDFYIDEAAEMLDFLVETEMNNN